MWRAGLCMNARLGGNPLCNAATLGVVGRVVGAAPSSSITCDLQRTAKCNILTSYKNIWHWWDRRLHPHWGTGKAELKVVILANKDRGIYGTFRKHFRNYFSEIMLFELFAPST